MENKNVTLNSPDGKQYVEITNNFYVNNDVSGFGNPRGRNNIGHIYIEPIVDEQENEYEFSDKDISDFIKISDIKDSNAFSDLKVAEHLLRIAEIDRIAEIKLPIYLNFTKHFGTTISTKEFDLSHFAGYIFTIENHVFKYEDDASEARSLEVQKNMLCEEVADYNYFLSGNSWSYTLYDVIPDKDGDYSRVSGCSDGFLGDSAVDDILDFLDAKDWIFKIQENEQVESLGR